MANFQPASFIPKEPISSESQHQSSGPRRMSLLLLISMIVAIFTLLLGGGVFGYRYYISGQLEAKKQQLQEAQSAFEPELIEDLIELDERIKAAESLVDEHVAMTPVFSLLEEETLQSVRLRNLEIQNTDTGASVTVAAGAQDYASISLQADALKQNNTIKDAEVSGFSQQATAGDSEEAERIQFQMKFSVPQEFIRYKNTLSSS